MALSDTPVTPKIEKISQLNAFVHTSRKERINDIFEGFLTNIPNYNGVTDVGVRLFGPNCDSELLKIAAASGNRPTKTGLKLWLKTLFLKGQFNWAAKNFDKNDANLLVVWNGIKGHRRVLADAARSMDIPVVFFEEEPLPGRITLDFKGVNYGSSLPRRSDFYTKWALENNVDLQHWRRLGKRLTPRMGGRGDVSQNDADVGLEAEKFLFCPLQVPGDSQITIYGKWIRSVEHMIDVLSEASKSLPEGWHLRIKEHPSAKISYRDKLNALADSKFRVDNMTNTFEQVEASQGVINVNSSVGLQSFFFDKPVFVLGQAFYAFDGAATKVGSTRELKAHLADPEKMTYLAATRDGLMSYLDQRYLVDEDSLKNGTYTLLDLIKRDQERDRILNSL